MGNKKWVLVTAGSRGIGAAIVKELVRQDYHVVFTYKNNSALAAVLMHSLNVNHEVCWCYPCDVASVESVKALSETLRKIMVPPTRLLITPALLKMRSALP